MTGPDTFNAICGAMTLCAGGFAIWLSATKARLRIDLLAERAGAKALRQELHGAQKDTRAAEAAYDDMHRRFLAADKACKTAINVFEDHLAAEPARIEEAIKDRRRAHLKAIGDAGRQRQAELRRALKQEA